jgi:hypothetical protein
MLTSSVRSSNIRAQHSGFPPTNERKETTVITLADKYENKDENKFFEALKIHFSIKRLNNNATVR